MTENPTNSPRDVSQPAMSQSGEHSATSQPEVLPRPHSSRQRSAFWGLLRETAIVIVLSLLIATGVRVFLAQAFVIPSASMEDTLQLQDRVMVSKLTTRFGEIHRGDVVVFQDPGNWLPPAVSGTGAKATIRQGLEYVGVLPNSAQGHLIKRVIGLPGDTITCCDDFGRLIINGVAIDESDILKPGTERASETDFSITVPDGQIWVMGDNREDSSDSRYNGPVGLEFVTGRAFAVVWPVADWASLSRPAVYANADVTTDPAAAPTTAPTADQPTP